MNNKIEYIRIYKKQSYKVNKDIPEYIDIPISNCAEVIDITGKQLPNIKIAYNTIYNFSEAFDIDIREYYGTSITVYKRNKKFIFDIHSNQIHNIVLFYDKNKKHKTKLKDICNLIKTIGIKQDDGYIIDLEEVNSLISIKEGHKSLKFYLYIYE